MDRLRNSINTLAELEAAGEANFHFDVQYQVVYQQLIVLSLVMPHPITPLF